MPELARRLAQVTSAVILRPRSETGRLLRRRPERRGAPSGHGASAVALMVAIASSVVAVVGRRPECRLVAIVRTGRLRGLTRHHLQQEGEAGEVGLTAHRDEFLGEASNVVHYFSLVFHCEPPGADEAHTIGGIRGADQVSR